MRKILRGKLPPGKFPPIKFPPEESPPPRKISTQKIPTRNISVNIFKRFVFSLLSPLSLILPKRLFYISVFQNYCSRTFCGVLKKISSLPAIQEMFWIYWNCFRYFYSGNFSKIRTHQKEVSRESEKTCEESFCMRR